MVGVRVIPMKVLTKIDGQGCVCVCLTKKERDFGFFFGDWGVCEVSGRWLTGEKKEKNSNPSANQTCSLVSYVASVRFLSCSELCFRLCLAIIF